MQPWQVNFAHISNEVVSTAYKNWDMFSTCRADPAYMRGTAVRGEQLLKWAEETIDIEAAMKLTTNAVLTSAKYLETVCAAYNCAFDSDSQLKRLDTFQGLLTHGHGTLHSHVTEALLWAKLEMWTC